LSLHLQGDLSVWGIFEFESIVDSFWC
jgi:hypothetical protein